MTINFSNLWNSWQDLVWANLIATYLVVSYMITFLVMRIEARYLLSKGTAILEESTILFLFGPIILPTGIVIGSLVLLGGSVYYSLKFIVYHGIPTVKNKPSTNDSRPPL